MLSLIVTDIFMVNLVRYHVSVQIETDTTFFMHLNYLFFNVDKSKVPYGILRDYSMEFTNIENYSGSAALADGNYAAAFWDVYQTFLSSRVCASAMGSTNAATVDCLWCTQPCWVPAYPA